MAIPEQTHIGARWGPRKETVADCTTKLHSFLLQLAAWDALLGRGWLKCAKQAESHPERIIVSRDALEDLLVKGRFRSGRDKVVIEDMGFRPHRLWNGSEEAPAHVSVECGAYLNLRSMPAPNTIWVELPSDGLVADRVLQPANLALLVRTIVEIWDPDWARISTNRLEAEIYSENPYVGQMAGWFTYVSDRYGDLPALDSEFEVSRISNQGSLIVIPSIDRPTVSKSPHVASIRTLSQILDRAGMLAPTPELQA
jgi:hypothetical protein